MSNRLKRRDKRRKIMNAITVPVFFLLAVISIKVGIMSGDFLFSIDTKIVRNIEAESFKTTLNKSFPIIDMVYNSGNISVSVSGEIKSLIRSIFSFDLNTPISILNTQSPLFHSYYTDGYQLVLEEQKKNEMENKEKENDKIVEYDPRVNGKEHYYKEEVSSITHEDELDRNSTLEKGNFSEGEIVIHNETNYKIDVDRLLKEPLSFAPDRKGPRVLIFHTHTSESYITNPEDIENKSISSWSKDERYNVVRVGEELAQHLRKKYGIEVIHNGTVHDYPSYNGAYGRSLDTVDKILKSYPSIKVVFDIHRDGLGEGEKLKTAVNINGKSTSKVMFVLGTHSERLPHPGWEKNLKFALHLQHTMNEKYPGLARHIFISSNRYNHHLSEGALIIEIGADGDTLDEAIESTKYIAEVINDVIN